jgi:hypothetical protein
MSQMLEPMIYAPGAVGDLSPFVSAPELPFPSTINSESPCIIASFGERCGFDEYVSYVRVSYCKSPQVVCFVIRGVIKLFLLVASARFSPVPWVCVKEYITARHEIHPPPYVQV